MFWKDGLSKKIALEYNLSFLYYRERWYFFFPKIWFYPRRKMKDDLSQKNTRKYDIFFKRSEKWSFQKVPRWDMIFVVLSGKMVFFSRKHDIFSLGGKREMTLLKKFMEIWYFLCTQRAGVTKVAPRPSVKKKNQRWSYRAKIHLKVIDVLDWHSRKRSAILCAFTETFTGVFMYCSPAKKNQET